MQEEGREKKIEGKREIKNKLRTVKGNERKD